LQKTVFSGVAPSGTIHLGNYLGAVKNWVELQETHSCIFCVVDLHAITIPQDPVKLRQKILEVAAIYLAAGIDPEKSIVFVQSHNPDHTELAWILNTITKNSDLTRMTQLKDKTGIIDFDSMAKNILKWSKEPISKKIKESTLIKKLSPVKLIEVVNETATQVAIKFLKDKFLTPFNKAGVGLFDYPVLMASDILLYNTDIVPVGEDQKQHVELTKTLARRFNQTYGETLKTPEALIKKEGARIMGLDDPTKKMSKSAKSPSNYIALTDSPDTIRKKIQKAVTDSEAEVKFNPETKPAISNLLTIYSLVSDTPINQLEEKYKDHTSYAEFKKDLAETIINFLSPFQGKYNELMANPGQIKEALAKGAQSAKKISGQTMSAVKNKIGLF
jgi:tryptophanyl-tRNA synthetase